MAKEWLTKKQENLEGKFYSPIALTRIRTDDDLKERLEKLSKKPTSYWTPEEDSFFNSAWSFGFTSLNDMKFFLDELKDKEDLVLYAELL